MEIKRKIYTGALMVALTVGTACAAPVNLTVTKDNDLLKINKLIEYSNYQKADAVLNDIIKKNPKNISAQALRIVSWAKQCKLNAAQDALDNLLPKYPDNAELHYAQGIVYMKRLTSSDMNMIKNRKKLINGAIEQFELALQLDSKHDRAMNALGVAYIKLGDFAQAQKCFENALKIDSKYSTAIDNLGTVYLVNGRLSKAETLFKESLKYNAKNPTAYYHLAQVDLKQNNLSEAIKNLNNSLAIDKNSSIAYNLLGETYFRQGNEVAAINAFRKASSIRPESTLSYLNLATIYKARNDYEFAIEQFRNALSIDPKLYLAEFNIAKLCFKKGAYKDSLETYEKLINNRVFVDESLTGIAKIYLKDKTLFTHEQTLNLYNFLCVKSLMQPNNAKFTDLKSKVYEISSKDLQKELDVVEKVHKKEFKKAEKLKAKKLKAKIKQEKKNVKKIKKA